MNTNRRSFLVTSAAVALAAPSLLGRLAAQSVATQTVDPIRRINKARVTAYVRQLDTALQFNDTQRTQIQQILTNQARKICAIRQGGLRPTDPAVMPRTKAVHLWRNGQIHAVLTKQQWRLAKETRLLRQTLKTP